MKLLIVKIDHYPNFDMPKIYHSCGIRKKSNGSNELIDQAMMKCVSPQAIWHTGSFMIQKSIKCLTRYI